MRVVETDAHGPVTKILPLFLLFYFKHSQKFKKFPTGIRRDEGKRTRDKGGGRGSTPWPTNRRGRDPEHRSQTSRPVKSGTHVRRSRRCPPGTDDKNLIVKTSRPQRDRERDSLTDPSVGLTGTVELPEPSPRPQRQVRDCDLPLVPPVPFHGAKVNVPKTHSSNRVGSLKFTEEVSVCPPHNLTVKFGWTSFLYSLEVLLVSYVSTPLTLYTETQCVTLSPSPTVSRPGGLGTG